MLGDNPVGLCAKCRELLSQGLNLCVRARKMDQVDRRDAMLSASGDPVQWQESGRFDAFTERYNAVNPDRPLATRSGTLHLWMIEQYEADLAEWEKLARAHLSQGCSA